MNCIKKIIIIDLLVFFCSLTLASCPQFYPNGETIHLSGTIELCNSFFVTQYDDINKRALFSSELLQPQGHDLPRKNTFHPDKRLKFTIRPAIYAGTQKDKGHLAPSDDSTTAEEMFDTFLMSNMTPQNPKLNRGPWKKLEIETRKIAMTYKKPTIVVTGAIYEDDKKIANLVPIPSGYYKILYMPDGSKKAFFAENTETSGVRSITINKINSLSGVKFPK